MQNKKLLKLNTNYWTVMLCNTSLIRYCKSKNSY